MKQENYNFNWEYCCQLCAHEEKDERLSLLERAGKAVVNSFSNAVRTSRASVRAEPETTLVFGCFDDM